MTIILNHINRENERLTTPEILPSCSKQRQNDSIIVSDPNERQRFLPENFNEKATQSQCKKESDLSSQTQNRRILFTLPATSHPKNQPIKHEIYDTDSP